MEIKFLIGEKMSNAKPTNHKEETGLHSGEVEVCNEEIKGECHGCYYWNIEHGCNKTGDPEEIAKQCEKNKSIYKLCAH
jgi:hypothetical protein